MAALEGFGPRKGGFWRCESKVANIFILRAPYLATLVIRTLVEQGLRDGGTKGPRGADRAVCLAAVIRLSKSGRAVRRGVEIFYAF